MQRHCTTDWSRRVLTESGGGGSGRLAAHQAQDVGTVEGGAEEVADTGRDARGKHTRTGGSWSQIEAGPAEIQSLSAPTVRWLGRSKLVADGSIKLACQPHAAMQESGRETSGELCHGWMMVLEGSVPESEMTAWR